MMAYCSGCADNGRMPEPEQGILDLSEWDFESRPIVSLGGDWNYWWGQLLPPEKLPEAQHSQDGLLRVPGFWRHQTDPRNVEATLPTTGSVTMSLKVLLPAEGVPNVLALSLRGTNSASRLYAITGSKVVEVISHGSVSEREAGEVPDWIYAIENEENYLPGIEFSIDNSYVWEEPNEDFMHHDIIRLPNGNYLGVVETIQNGPVPNGPWTPICYALYGPNLCNGITEFFPWHGDKIIEWDDETKEIYWEWSTFDHFDMRDYDDIGGSWEEGLGQARYDWTHVNALWFSEEESAIYISVRHLSRIVKIDYPSGEIIWSMGLEMPSGDIDFGQACGSFLNCSK